ncbi:MAG TPA: hypothetical protein V6D23_28820, partial [Candidatus Obscuribacterales bacterium]
MPVDERESTPIGIVGSGFVATGFARLLSYAAPELSLASVLSRRPPETLPEPLCRTHITASLDDFLARSALI